MNRPSLAVALSITILQLGCAAGSHENTDEGHESQTPVTQMDSMATGQHVPTTPPPQGSLATPPADSALRGAGPGADSLAP